MSQQLTALEQLKLKSEAANCERVAKYAETSIAAALIERAKKLREQVQEAQN